jgi:uncharacterized protein
MAFLSIPDPRPDPAIPAEQVFPANPEGESGSIVCVRNLSSKGVAAALGVSERSVRLYARAGRIPFSETPGGHRRFDLVEVKHALARSGQRKAPTLAMLHGRRREIAERARKHGAHNVRVFGSVATGRAVEESDVDLLVRLDRGRSYSDIDDLEADLAELLGYDVDVLTEGACHGRFASVLDEAVAL